MRVRGAREHNLKNVSLDIPRNVMVVFTGVSGSGKSSLAFGTLYAEAQRRYLESVSPYARRLFHQLAVPDVDEITGLPPAVALQQQRGAPTTRSSVGSVTTLSNLLRMLYSRAGTYPAGQPPLHAEDFSPNTPQGACPACHGLGRIFDATEASMVPNDRLSIRERAIAAWPPAWHGQNLRDIAVTLGFDVDKPWRQLSRKDRDWLLFTDEQPTVPVYAGFTPQEVRRALRRKEEPSYMGTFTGARRYVLRTFATTESALMKRRVARFLITAECQSCGGRRLRREALSVTFAGRDIAAMSALSMAELSSVITESLARERERIDRTGSEHALVVKHIGDDLVSRLAALLDLGLGYLSLDRSTPTLSPGELQRLRLATQVQSNLFGVVYVLDEPSAGLHPSDTEALLRALHRLKASGNSLFVIEHDLDIVRHAEWIVDVGPGAGSEGGEILYCGPPAGLRRVTASHTRRYLYPAAVTPVARGRRRRPARGWLRLEGVTRNNVRNLNVEFPLQVMTTVTGVSGSGKSSLVSQALVELVTAHIGQLRSSPEETDKTLDDEPVISSGGRITDGTDAIKRLVSVDQRPIGRTPRSNLATYTGLFDQVRKLFAATRKARARGYDAGRFSFNVPKGRCERCAGEGFVMVELLFLPSVYAPCPLCHGSRYNAETLEVEYRGKNVAQVLDMTVDAARTFFEGDASVQRSLDVLRQVGVGYLRLGQPATELSGGEAQRIKLATELQHGGRGETLYVLDEPTTGLHPADVDKLLGQLHALVDAGNTVIVVEHDMSVVAASDWVVDVGPGAGNDGGRVVAAGFPDVVAAHDRSMTARYLRRAIPR